MSVHWFLSGNREKPSSRIHGFNLHEFFLKNGFSSYIDYHPNKSSIVDLPIDRDLVNKYVQRLKKGEIVIVQKLRGPKTIDFLDQLKRKNINTIYLDCDVPCKVDEASRVNVVVVSSIYLAKQYKKNGIANVICIEDAAEVFKEPQIDNSGEIKCVWFGLPGKQKWDSVSLLKERIEKTERTKGLKCSLSTISSNAEADHVWSENSFSLINTFDISVIPVFYENSEAFAKSSNRVIQSMALGLPVIASPIPSYLNVIQNGVNGYICNEIDEWIVTLYNIQNSNLLLEMKMNAYEFALKHYSLEIIFNNWKALLADLGGDGEKNDLSGFFSKGRLRSILTRIFRV